MQNLTGNPNLTLEQTNLLFDMLNNQNVYLINTRMQQLKIGNLLTVL